MNKNGTIQYILLWTLVGILAGLAVLFAQGKIVITDSDWSIFGTSISGKLPNSFSNAVSKTAPAVVSLQVQSLIEVPIKENARRQLEQAFGNHLPNLTQTKRHSSSGSGVILDTRGYVITNCGPNTTQGKCQSSILRTIDTWQPVYREVCQRASLITAYCHIEIEVPGLSNFPAVKTGHVQFHHNCARWSGKYQHQYDNKRYRNTCYARFIS